MSVAESSDPQKTLGQDVSMSGIGLFTGEKVSVKLCPMPADSGIVFQRVDLPDQPIIPAQLDFVREAPRNTRLCSGNAVVFMVEHLLSALSAYGIDNVRIEVKGSEIPSGDGSALPFVNLIEKAGFKKLSAPRRYIRIQNPVYWSEAEVHLVALPSNETRFTYTLHYPYSSMLRAQYFSFAMKSEVYKIEIAPCRTFSLYEEILPLIDKGIIKGGGLENAVVIQGDKVLNPEGTRFQDEMVRHKILDLIGDLSLLGRPLLAHVIALRSGHSSNLAFAKTLMKNAILPEKGKAKEREKLFSCSVSEK